MKKGVYSECLFVVLFSALRSEFCTGHFGAPKLHLSTVFARLFCLNIASIYITSIQVAGNFEC